VSPAKTHITGVRAVSIPVEDQDDALRGVDTDEILRWRHCRLAGRDDLRAYVPSLIPLTGRGSDQ
jgi:hypothetical protein